MRIKYTSEAEPAALPFAHYLLCKIRQLLKPFWLRLGNIETRLLQSKLKPIDRPVYVTGMARAGTTIALTLLDQHPALAAHRYRDMPQPYLPYLWNRLIDWLPLCSDTPKERVHKDLLMVTRDSPESVEEALWEHFFPHLHDESRPAVLGSTVCNPAFETCYRTTLGKLLLARRRSRYLSKANYNLTRLGYLARVIPEARFIVMTREPSAHFVSWVKQHEMFLRTQHEDPRWQEVIRMVGHCEFGRGQRFVHTGDDARMQEIRRHWDNGQRARAFGLYWASMYGHVLDLIEQDDHLRNAILFVRYEDLCKQPYETFARMLAHAELEDNRSDAAMAQRLDVVKAPDYYRAELKPDEAIELETATRDIAQRLGYRTQ